MKLLFDENISYRILKKLDIEFSESESIRNKSDGIIWKYAKDNNFTIVSYDEDFYELQLLKGFPPKFIWLWTGNIPTSFIAQLLNNKKKEIQSFIQDLELGILEIY